MLLIGTRTPELRGGPYNLVAGSADALLEPNTVVFEDVDREKLGGLNLGDEVEVNRRRVRVGGFTWGLTTLFGAYTFGEFDFARGVLGIDADRVSYVLVGLEPGANPAEVARELRERTPDAAVMTAQEFRRVTQQFMLVDAGIAGLLLMGVFVGFTVGLAIVGLSMVSSVQHHLREFGTLKALGATNADLRRILLMQAVAYSAAGSFVGAALLCLLAWSARSGRLNLIVEPRLLVALVPFVTTIAVASAMLAVRRVTKLDPGMVFR
jgi:putative ABC transport system permease protein